MTKDRRAMPADRVKRVKPHAPAPSLREGCRCWNPARSFDFDCPRHGARAKAAQQAELEAYHAARQVDAHGQVDDTTAADALLAALQGGVDEALAVEREDPDEPGDGSDVEPGA